MSRKSSQENDDDESDDERQSQVKIAEDEQMKQKFIYQIEKLKLLLQAPSSMRTTEICKEIADIVKEVKFLSTYKDKPEFPDLCRHLYIQTFEKGQQVFKQGDPADTFYIILKGSVKIFINEPTEYKNFMQLKEVRVYRKGEAFGELALQNNSPRSATVIAFEKSDLIVVEKKVFQEYLKRIQPSHINKMQLFLESLPVFSMFSQRVLESLALNAFTKNHPSQTIMLKQNTDPTHWYIIKRGRVKAIKKVNWHSNDENEDSLDRQIQKLEQSLKGKQKEGKKQEVNPLGKLGAEFIEIDELGEGEIFGDYAHLNEVELDCSYITAIPCQIVEINIQFIKEKIPQDTLEIYRKSLKKYPDDDELFQIYNEKKNWSKFKKSLVSNISVDKLNKVGFDRRLRLPELKPKYIDTPINIIDIKSSDNRIYFKYLENKISQQSESKRKIKNIVRIQDKVIKKRDMKAMIDQLSKLNPDQNIANSFQRQLKKLNLNK